MESFFKTHAYLVEHINAQVRRQLMDEVDWSQRLIGIKGTRGVGKTTFLLQYAKEHFSPTDHSCLYVNMNNFYFQVHGITEFAADFVNQGGKVLLIDQVFKQPHWSRELRKCYNLYPDLKIVFTGSSVMQLEKGNPELQGIVKSYNLRGFSFREFLNLKAGLNFSPVTLADLMANHQSIVKDIMSIIDPSKYFTEYLDYGFYPFFMEKRNYLENLLKTMNMMTEVDILLIKQIELKYLAKIKKLFYLLAVNGIVTPNISKLAIDINTSRATVMNYIKYLSDARLLNIIYPAGQCFPKKPSKVMLHNPNLVNAIYPSKVSLQKKMEIFWVNSLWKDHNISQSAHDPVYIVDNDLPFIITDVNTPPSNKYKDGAFNIQYAEGNQIKPDFPLWIFGFLY